MALPKELNTVTPCSKGITVFLFFSLPIVAFLLGMNYQINISRQMFLDSSALMMDSSMSVTEPQIEEATGYLVYENTEFGFDFKYPNNMSVTENDERAKGGSYLLVLAPKAETRDTNSYNLLQITVSNSNRTLQDALQSHCDSGSCPQMKDTQSINVDGLPALRLSNWGPVPNEHIYFKKGNILYSLSMVLDDRYSAIYSSEEKLDLLDGIVESFEFSK